MRVKCCFVIDATGSMAPWIHAAKTQTSSIMNDIKKKYENVDLQISAVFYRDINDAERSIVVNFTDNCEQFTSDISDITAYGGDDMCEDIACGFEEALQLNWNDADVKNIFLICDAPPHGNEWHDIGISDNYPDNDYDLGSYISALADRNIKLSIIKVNNSINKMIEKMTNIYGKPLVVSDIICNNDLFEPIPLIRTSGFHPMGGSFVTPEEHIFNRSVMSQVEESIRESQSEH